MSIQERADRAAELKRLGLCNCAQAVAVVLADQTDLTEEQWKQLTAGFCAGMGTMEATCGALIGAGMVVGARTGGVGTLRSTRRLFEDFRDRCGATVCRDLKGVGTGAVLCPCEECVRNAVLAYGAAMGLDE